jgi:D-alanyl-D-alanine carboxypeptidase/D-alanyl-D-alanine-endopeptidase (penicillin-binding protein 4)
MTAILSYMKTRSAYPEVFEKSLPLAGDGTLSVFSSDNFARVGLRAKSGSMTRVRCYAGYLETRSGKTLAFTVMLNNFSCSQSAAIRKIGELLSSLMKEY